MFKILLVVSGFLIYSQVPVGGQTEGKCPETNAEEYLYRLGKSRFYILQKPKGMHVNWWQAKGVCAKHGLKLAKIDDLPTSVHVTNVLNAFLRQKAWAENYYWIDAKFDRSKQIYRWQDGNKPAIQLANFFYKKPKPKGYGDFFLKDGSLAQEGKMSENCLMLSLPLPLGEAWNPNVAQPYGMHASWWERPCKLLMKSNILCESTDSTCENQQHGSVFTRPSSKYYNDLWPLGNRKFVVYWKPLNFKQAEQLCKKNKMVLYKPRKGDKCLIGYLKNFFRLATSYSFWTSVKYKWENQVFSYPDGTEVPENAQNFTYEYALGKGSVYRRRRKRDVEDYEFTDYQEHPRMKRESSGFHETETCASMTWNDEHHPYNPTFCDCSFNSLTLSPENCKNPIGTICQHPDHAEAECDESWISPPIPPGNYKANVSKFDDFLVFTGPTPDETVFRRSAYKQLGKSGKCPKGFKKARINGPRYWLSPKEYQNAEHPYDYYAPYWLVPKHKNDSICWLSKVSYSGSGDEAERLLLQQDCETFAGFILCVKKEIRT